MWEALAERVRDRSATVGVIGLGYVGLPLALAFAREYSVMGFDVRPELVQAIRQGEATDFGVRREALVAALNSRFVPTMDFDRLSACDIIVVCVGTPLTEGRDPDLSQIIGAAREIARRLRPGQFVILESTSYPGTTEEVLVPALETSGLSVGIHFGVAYSPERMDPGNGKSSVESIPKLVGGLDEESTELARLFYSQVISTVIPVSNARVAEAAKIVENLFRAVNIALVNEVALIMERLNIDTWEVIRAASTKPFGYMPFYPGPGVGGHCIPLDPYYLSYRARKAGYLPRFIELSGDVNEYMKFHAVELLLRGLQEVGKRPRGATVAILGLAFKKDVADTRESPAGRIIEECEREGMLVRAFDPRAKAIATRTGTVTSCGDVASALAGADAAVIVTDHTMFRGLDYDALTQLMAAPAVWVDTRGILESTPKGSVAFGLGRPSGRIPPKEDVSHAALSPVRESESSLPEERGAPRYSVRTPPQEGSRD